MSIPFFEEIEKFYPESKICIQGGPGDYKFIVDDKILDQSTKIQFIRDFEYRVLFNLYKKKISRLLETPVKEISFIVNELDNRIYDSVFPVTHTELKLVIDGKIIDSYFTASHAHSSVSILLLNSYVQTLYQKIDELHLPDQVRKYLKVDGKFVSKQALPNNIVRSLNLQYVLDKNGELIYTVKEIKSETVEKTDPKDEKDEKDEKNKKEERLIEKIRNILKENKSFGYDEKLSPEIMKQFNLTYWSVCDQYYYVQN